MSDQNSPPPNRRRSSIVDMFTSRPTFGNNNQSNQNAMSSSPPSSAVQPSPNPPQHRRGTSITALGLTTTSPSGQTQNSPFAAFARQRRASVATSSSGSPEFRNSFGDEPAVIEDDEAPKSPPNNSPLGRRLSFGAQALRDVKQGNGPGSPGAGRRPSSSLFTLSESNENMPPQSLSHTDKGPPSSTAKTTGMSQGLSHPHPRVLFNHWFFECCTDNPTGEGFNWSDALRDRTKRSPSFSSANPFTGNAMKPRTTSTSPAEPPKEMPKPAEPLPITKKKPDHLGERMLRGDFMMD
jgi:hypothetical protein